MYFFSLIKDNAKSALRPYWGQSFANILIVSMVGLLFLLFEATVQELLHIPVIGSFYNSLTQSDTMTMQALALPAITTVVTLVLSTLNAMILIPLSLGQLRWFSYLSANKPLPMTSLFAFFGSPKLFSRSIWLRMSIFIRMTLMAILFLTPIGLLLSFGTAGFLASVMVGYNLLSLGMIFLAFGLSLLLFLFWLGFCTRYYAAPYILAMNSKLTTRQILELSAKATKGRRTSILLFEFSFIGWWFLNILIVPLFYFLPYVMTARGLYVRYMLESINYPWRIKQV